MNARLQLNRKEWKKVEYCRYLGVMLRSDGRMDSELEQRIGATSKIIGAIGMAVIGKRELSQKTKMRIVNTMVIPALTYGCETWVLLRSQKSKIQATEMKV